VFGSSKEEHTRVPRRHLSVALSLAAASLSLLLGACAQNNGAAPAMQWQFNSSEAGDASPQMYAVDTGPAVETPVERASLAPVSKTEAEDSEHSASSSNCGSADPSGWSDSCYVYRGGRDPVTGRAYRQL
jgi:hypothetical protein